MRIIDWLSTPRGIVAFWVVAGVIIASAMAFGALGRVAPPALVCSGEYLTCRQVAPGEVFNADKLGIKPWEYAR